jgi:hypothetical protein
LTSIRLPVTLLDELRDLARQETQRTGETVTWARLLRDGARRLLKDSKQSARPQPE